MVGAPLVAQTVKNPPAMQETWVRSLGQEDPLKKRIATHSSIIAGKLHGQRTLVGYSSCGYKQSDTTKQLSTQWWWESIGKVLWRNWLYPHLLIQRKKTDKHFGPFAFKAVVLKLVSIGILGRAMLCWGSAPEIWGHWVLGGLGICISHEPPRLQVILEGQGPLAGRWWLIVRDRAPQRRGALLSPTCIEGTEAFWDPERGSTYSPLWSQLCLLSDATHTQVHGVLFPNVSGLLPPHLNCFEQARGGDPLLSVPQGRTDCIKSPFGASPATYYPSDFDQILRTGKLYSSPLSAAFLLCDSV